MVVETLGDAFAASWRITARCAWGKREGMKAKRECHYTRELDLETLVWTRGPNFPLSSLDSRLMCPRCRSCRVAVLFQPPTVSNAARDRTPSGWRGRGDWSHTLLTMGPPSSFLIRQLAVTLLLPQRPKQTR